MIKDLEEDKDYIVSENNKDMESGKLKAMPLSPDLPMVVNLGLELKLV